MSLTWLAHRGLTDVEEEYYLFETVRLDEGLLAASIRSVMRTADPKEMAHALSAIERALSNPSAKYRLKVVAKQQGGREDLRGWRKRHNLQLAMAKDVHRRQAAEGGRMKRAVAEAADEFSVSRAGVYRAIKELADRLAMAFDGDAHPQDKLGLARLYGFCVDCDVDHPSALPSQAFENWLYGFAGASPADEG